MGVRLAVPLEAGPCADTIVLEPAHQERFLRTAACVAIREGLLGTTERALARIVPGRVRERHGNVLCLDAFAIELLDGDGTLRARVEFGRRTLEAFALARAVHRLAASGTPGTRPLRYSVHAVANDDAPLIVDLPCLPPCSLADMTAGAVASGHPDDAWIATLVSPAVQAGFDTLAETSRRSGVEVAGRIMSRVGFDATRRCFVRVLDRLVVSRTTRADALSVVSTAASWGDFLRDAPMDGTQAITSVHTHLHLQQKAGGEGASGDHLLAEGGGLSAAGDPCISLDDLVTHYTVFSDVLSAAAIVSVFPERRELRLYGYTPGAELRLEPGFWALAG